MNEFFEEMI